MSTPYEMSDCSYAPYFYEAIRLRYPEYCRELPKDRGADFAKLAGDRERIKGRKMQNKFPVVLRHRSKIRAGKP